MQAGDVQILRNEFRRRAEVQRRQQLFQARLREEREDRHDATLEQDFLDLAQAAIQVTQEEIASFDAKLVRYEELTTEELIHQREILDNLRADLDDMLSRAYVLEDGRRVFKTENGKRVFDEHGVEVGANVVDPDAISDKLPTWEEFSRGVRAYNEQAADYEETLEFQQELYDARERLEDGDISAKEFEDMQRRIAADAPESIRAKMVAEQVTGPIAPIGRDFATSAAKPAISLDTLEINAPGLGG